jgi:hypothetical protein
LHRAQLVVCPLILSDQVHPTTGQLVSGGTKFVMFNDLNIVDGNQHELRVGVARVPFPHSASPTVEAHGSGTVVFE